MSLPTIIDGKASAWAIQWAERVGAAYPSQWVITLCCAGFGMNVQAVCDDFGNLVQVRTV